MSVDPSVPPPVGSSSALARVRVVEHDPTWLRLAAEHATEVRRTLAAQSAFAGAIVHHVGSTAVPGLAAKPVIDLLLAVPGHDALRALDRKDSRRALAGLGYRAHGEHGIVERRFFTRADPASGDHTHHLHAFVDGSDGAVRHLVFRDYLRAHPAVATTYGVLKQSLAASCEDDIEAYKDGKHAFIREHEARALEWDRLVRGD